MFRKLLAVVFAVAALTPTADARRICPILCGKGSTGPTPPAVQALRPVATRAAAYQQFVPSIGGTSIQGQSRYQFYFAGADVKDVSVCYGNWAGPGEAAGPANLTIDAALELPFPFGVQQFKWTGSSTITLTPGTAACSDALPASLFATTAFPFTAYPANSQGWYRTNILSSVSTGFPGGVKPTNQTGFPIEQAIAAPAFTSQSLATGAMTIPSGGANVSAMTVPFAIVGHFASASMPGLCGLGDSIVYGVNATLPFITGIGWLDQTTLGTDGNQLWPELNLAIGGESSTGPFTTRSTFYPTCTTLDVGYGTNDIVGARTPAQINTSLQSIYAAAKAAGVPTVLGNYIIARATSANPSTFISTVGQTSLIEPSQDQLNALILGDIGTPSLTAAVDFSSAVQAAGSPQSWFNDGVVYTPNVTVTVSTNAFAFSTGTFTAADIGKTIYIPGAGAGGTALQTSISTVPTATSITTGANAATGLVAQAEQVVYGTGNLCTSDGIHPGDFCTARMTTTFKAAVAAQGQQLPARDLSWVKAGADWDWDFQNGRYFGLNPQATFDYASFGTGAGVLRTSSASGPTTNTSAALLPQFGPNKFRIIPGRGGMMEKTTINLFASPFTPGSQIGTVVNATQYTASIVGPGSMTLSGACTGTVTAGNPVTCTTSTTSLSASISGSPLAMQLELGAVATSPINGTRSTEDVPLPVSLFQTATNTQGSVAISIEGNPVSGPVLGSFGNQYIERASSTTISNNQNSTTLTATTGTGSNGHVVFGAGWNPSGRDLCGNGGTSASDANTFSLSSTQMYLGGRGNGGGNSLLGPGTAVIQRITHYPNRFGNGGVVSCQTATAP